MTSPMLVFWNSLLKVSCHYPGNLQYFLGAKLKEGSVILQGWAPRVPQVGSWDTPASRYKEAGHGQGKPCPRGQ